MVTVLCTDAQQLKTPKLKRKRKKKEKWISYKPVELLS